MLLSNEARSVIGLIIITIPTIEFGGYFLLTELRRRNGIIRTALQGSYYRAGHAHAGVLVILAIIAQLLIDAASFPSVASSLVRAGFFLPPILISAGFFLGAPTEGEKPRRPIVLVYLGAIILAGSALVLGLGLLLGGGAQSP